MSLRRVMRTHPRCRQFRLSFAKAQWQATSIAFLNSSKPELCHSPSSSSPSSWRREWKRHDFRYFSDFEWRQRELDANAIIKSFRLTAKSHRPFHLSFRIKRGELTVDHELPEFAIERTKIISLHCSQTQWVYKRNKWPRLRTTRPLVNRNTSASH